MVRQSQSPFFRCVIRNDYEEKNPVNRIAGNHYSHNHSTLHDYGFQ